ncbi:hypothetical protein STCU_12127 [Strigomonas culicis]|uniref:Uncharacterized protein n=1 Tax=Strigomonas culicis TaxID=28005 RepID=S9UXP4_9TRYP|nr:hypothetical protein STCU_12127 [Strigomonas culicis]|eukprot:EPY15315.1 hypothetical protein STCU_12127 [Strigomonas culicis]
MDSVPTEEKWDHSLESFVRKSTLGFAVGILPALLIARSPAVRGSIAALFTGLGSGVAYGEARYLFDHNVMFDKRNVIQMEVVPSKNEKKQQSTS